MVANPVRGEVDLQLGEDKFVLVATMRQLARFSKATGCESMQQFFDRLRDCELPSVLDALGLFTASAELADGTKLKGEEAGKRAEGNFRFDDTGLVRVAFLGLLQPFFRKNPLAEEETDPPNVVSAPKA